LRRVAVTGMGVVSAIGSCIEDFERALFAGRCGIRAIDAPWADRLRFRHAAQVAGFDASAHFEEKPLALLDPFAQYGIAAAREAVRQAGVSFDPERTAVITGTGGGGQPTTDAAFAELYGAAAARVSPLNIARGMNNAAASHISMELGITGPVYTVSTACSSAAHAIGQAFHLVRAGAVDAAIAGGSESVMSFGLLKSWEAMRVVAPDTCRPFSRDRQGLILGEGAGMLVLEEWETAQARGAAVLGEIAGFGMSSDAHHITQPAVRGAARAMRAALADAAAPLDEVVYINAHGTGTAANDSTETRAIRDVFGSGADRVRVSSTKSMHGHALGAAGAIEAVATLLALGAQCAPPTVNYTTPDPECDLDVTPNEKRPLAGEWALSNSFAFGGLNAVLVFRATPRP
jgi:nodulation protein E